MLEITKLTPYDPKLEVDPAVAGRIVKTGFGGRTIEDCINDASNHLATAQFVQFAHLDENLVGFGMYETFDKSKVLYLNGIVIEKQNQAKRIGSTMVSAALLQTGADTLVAVTRNPAILRIMEDVCDYVQPSPKLGEKQIVP